jgi:hypothetical protein
MNLTKKKSMQINLTKKNHRDESIKNNDGNESDKKTIEMNLTKKHDGNESEKKSMEKM